MAEEVKSDMNKEETQMISDPISMHRFQRGPDNADQLKKELEYMKELFTSKLPLGDDTTKIESYFNYLQEILDDPPDGTGKILDRETFPEDVKGRNYQYFSSFDPSIHRRSYDLLASEHDLESTSDQSGSPIPAQIDFEVSEDTKPLLPDCDGDNSSL